MPEYFVKMFLFLMMVLDLLLLKIIIYQTKTYLRQSKDAKLDQRGKELLDFCI